MIVYMKDKSDLRNFAKTIRNSLNFDQINEISSCILNKICASDVYKNSKNIMIYYPINNEVSLIDLIFKNDKNFYFPVVSDDDMFCVRFDKELGFKTGKFGISEPIGSIITDYSFLDLILVPALAVDIYGYRVGYGKGYYDKFLKKCHSSCRTMIPIYSQLILKNIPKDDWDIPVDYIVTENDITKI